MQKMMKYLSPLAGYYIVSIRRYEDRLSRTYIEPRASR
jgi:hypothetical protein